MTFCLDSIVIKPEDGIEIKNAVILLHGYGGDGKDISMLSLNWKRYMPNTVFICPNGHERCDLNPSGFQWFDLSKEDSDYILEQSILAENKLKKFIEEIKIEFNLKNSQICLSGFSQGCMMSINLGFTSKDPFNCIVGFSGKIIDKEDLSLRLISKTKTLLIHGEKDEIVPPYNLLEAKDFFTRNNISIETLMIKDCDHHIPVEASSNALKFIKNNFNSQI